MTSNSSNSSTTPSPDVVGANSTSSAPTPSPSVNSTVTSDGSSSNSSSASTGTGVGVSVLAILVIVGISFFFIRRRRRRRRKAALEGRHESASAPGVWGGTATANPRDYVGSSSSQSFSFEQLRIATKNFSESELLGKGGFGPVYRGTLPDDGTLVAVKCIADNSNQGAKEYKAEVSIISNLRHRNLVRLRGWCQADEGKFLLVYDYMPNGSLDYLLFNDKQCFKLSWDRRYSIASGLGSALQYLHEECDNVIIHRDIKSSNVLLDESFNTKLGDFGLSRQVDQGITSLTTTMAGTHGYMAPESLLGPRKATRESDVYAFGAVLLELVCGKRAVDYASYGEEEGMLVDRVWHLYSQGKVMEAVDVRLEGEYDNEEARRLLLVGLSCSNPDPKARPKIRRALEALLGSVPLPSVPLAKPIMTFGPPPPMSITQILEDTTTNTNSTSTSSTTNTNSTSTSSTHPHSTSSSDYVRLLP